MNTIKGIFKTKSIWPVATAIVILFAVVPFSIFKFSLAILLALLLIEFIFLAKNIKGLACLIFSYSLMIPYTNSKVGTGVTLYITYCCVAFFLIYSILILQKKIGYTFKVERIAIVPLLLIGTVFSLQNGSTQDLQLIVFFLLSSYGFYYLAFNDPITLKEFFYILDIVFYCTAFYVIQEIVFFHSPYQNTIYADIPADFVMRAKGLMGHPLILSSFLTFFLVSQFIKGIIFSKWSIVNFIALIPLSILSASRTLLILIIACGVLYVFLTKAFKKISFYFILAAIGIAVLYSPKLTELISQSPLERLASANSDQRLGSYPVVFDVFIHNFFGLGLDRHAISKELSYTSYHLNLKYDRFFLTFDNMYLTCLVGYGIFSFLVLLIFINPIKTALKIKSPETKKHLNALILLTIIWLLQNFSFDSFIYFPSNSIYFMLSALILKDMNSLNIASVHRQVNMHQNAIQRSNINSNFTELNRSFH